MKRWLFISAIAAAALLTFQPEGRASDVQGLDSVYVFQPHNGWHVSVKYEGGFEQAGLKIPLEITYPNVTTEATLKVNMVNSQSHRVGVSGGYGPFSLSFSKAIGKKPDRDLSFNWITNSFGILFQYTLMQDTATSSLEYPGSEPAVLPEVPSLAHFWRVSGYYAFNHKKFAYASVYKGKVIQRKSAGSFMVGAKFQHANLVLEEPQSIVGSLMFFLTGYRTYQFSLGAGYSYNWVLYHRDARSARELEGLRNLTINVTAIPLLTVVNEMQMTHVGPSGLDTQVLKLSGGVRPNALARLGIGYAIGHFYITSHLDFHFQHFRSRELTEKDFQDDIDYTYRLSVLGHLYSWGAGLELHYRF